MKRFSIKAPGQSKQASDFKGSKTRRTHTDGVLMRIGYRDDGGSELLEYLFPSRDWTESTAREWVARYNKRGQNGSNTMEEFELIEAWDGTPIEGNVDREKRVVRDVALLNSWAQRQTRYYSPEVMQKAKDLFEGRPVFINHDKDNYKKETRPVEQKIGSLRNIRVVEGQGKSATLKGDLRVMAGPLGNFMLDVAEQTPDQAGFSINARGGLSRRDGKEFVEQIAHVYSVDLVSEASATTSIFESLKTPQDGDDEMEVKELKEQIDTLEKKIKDLEASNATLTEDKGKAEKEREELKEKLAQEEHALMIAKVLEEAKLPEKITKDEALMETLNACEDEAGAKKLVESFQKLVGKAGGKQPEGNGPLKEGGNDDDKKKLSAESLAESVRG